MKTCKRCVLDTTVHDISFDSNGECTYCEIHNELEKTHPLSDGGTKIQQIISNIKKAGRNGEYDCVCGLSGGRDSSYTLLKAIEYGLRPLVVSVDNGWATDIANQNIENACKKLGLKLKVVKFDWEEYKDLQRSLFLAGVPDVDSPSDLAIYAVLHKEAKDNKIKYILNGHSFRTEGSSPISWSYFDPVYIKHVQSKYGTIPYNSIKSIPTISFFDLFMDTFIHSVREVRILEYMDYRKDMVDIELKDRLDWQDYGGHHQENKFTHFIQSYYLPIKFNIDKRKTELSAQIRSNHISRNDALKIISEPCIYNQDIVNEVIGRLGFTTIEFETIMNQENHSYKEFKNLIFLYRLLKYPINIITKMKLLPRILYLKYCK